MSALHYVPHSYGNVGKEAPEAPRKSMVRARGDCFEAGRLIIPAHSIASWARPLGESFNLGGDYYTKDVDSSAVGPDCYKKDVDSPAVGSDLPPTKLMTGYPVEPIHTIA